MFVITRFALDQFNHMHQSMKAFIKHENTFVHVSYPNFVRGLLFDGMQPLVDRFEVLGTLCCAIREVSRDAGS